MLIVYFPNLQKLNYATITEEERKEAEIHYLVTEYEVGFFLNSMYSFIY